ncbi:MAG TPA: hypothetical protein VL947_14210 [Cytophagales bacterium]|nr:hypothetical protein [Cytophagales bacterium]
MNNKSVFDVFLENLSNVLRGENKLNLIFVSILVILTGIIVYMFYNERRIKKLEDKLKIKK